MTEHERLTDLVDAWKDAHATEAAVSSAIYDLLDDMPCDIDDLDPELEALCISAASALKAAKVLESVESFKICSVESGCDWADAGYEIILMPKSLDAAELYKKYNDAGRYSGTGEFFADWLVATQGCEHPDVDIFSQ